MSCLRSILVEADFATGSGPGVGCARLRDVGLKSIRHLIVGFL